MTPQDLDFCELCRIVGDVYRLPPYEIMGSRKHAHSEARAVLATIWSEEHTLEDTAKRLMRKSPGIVIVWRAKTHKLIAAGGTPAGRIDEVTRRVAESIPHVIGIYPENKLKNCLIG